MDRQKKDNPTPKGHSAPVMKSREDLAALGQTGVSSIHGNMRKPNGHGDAPTVSQADMKNAMLGKVDDSGTNMLNEKLAVQKAAQERNQLPRHSDGKTSKSRN